MGDHLSKYSMVSQMTQRYSIKLNICRQDGI